MQWNLGRWNVNYTVAVTYIYCSFFPFSCFLRRNIFSPQYSDMQSLQTRPPNEYKAKGWMADPSCAGNREIKIALTHWNQQCQQCSQQQQMEQLGSHLYLTVFTELLKGNNCAWSSAQPEERVAANPDVPSGNWPMAMECCIAPCLQKQGCSWEPFHS